MKDGRWVEVSPSQFAHEQAGLDVVKALLPDAPPFRAWSNFEFRDNSGRWHEVDLLVLARDTLYLIELKHYRGTIRGNDHVWSRDGRRSEDSPLLLARRKAQRFSTLLKDTLRAKVGNYPRNAVPYVQELVFLHHPDTRCELPDHSKINLYGLDGDASTGLPGLSHRLLAPATRAPVTEEGGLLISDLMKAIGLAPRRQREVGSWIIDETPLADGDGWQDWPAFHHVDTERHARIRFYVPKPGASSADAFARRSAVEHEFRLLARLRHDGLQVPVDLVNNPELGVGLVFPQAKDDVPLDLWLADHRGRLTLEQQFDLIAQLADIVQYAHRNRVVHRSLNPRAVSIRERGTANLVVQVLDWDTAGVLPANADSGVTRLSEGPLSVMAGSMSDAARTFSAPEGLRPADPAKLDVFGLGALTFYLMSGGTNPATDRGGLLERLQREGGLDLAAEVPQVPTALRQLVLDATKGSPAERTESVALFVDGLNDVRTELVRIDDDVDPTSAGPGTKLGTDGRFVVTRRLGVGSTAVGLLVEDKQVKAERVLKVSLNSDAAQRLRAEALVLSKLQNEDRIVTLHDVLDDLDGHTALLLSFAGRTTLAEEMASRAGSLSLDQLERWGSDILAAVVALERSGVMHRDIKPSNLGIKTTKASSDSRVLMYDFSMAGIDVRNVEAGSPPYLDPFLGTGGRTQYDTAAERYGAAVVLFEMATGGTPRYGTDAQANPAVVTDDITLDPDAFDCAVRTGMLTFFRSALSRTAGQRPDTAEDMLRLWQNAFHTVDDKKTAEDDDRVRKADAGTLLAQAGLSVRGASALLTLQVTTVGELLALDVALLNRLVAREGRDTRREIKDRYREWTARLGKQRRRGRDGLMGLTDAKDLLLNAVTESRGSSTRRQAAEAILGATPGIDEFASVTEIAAHLGKAPQRGPQLIKELQSDWAEDDKARALLDALVDSVTTILNESGGVAAVATLREEVRSRLPADAASPGDVTARAEADRLAGGLLRVALDRLTEWESASGVQELVRRRHGRRLTLIAQDESLLAAAEAAAAHADDLVTSDLHAVIPAAKAASALRMAFSDGYSKASGQDSEMISPPSEQRLVKLAAAGSSQAAVSGRGELHNIAISPAECLKLALSGISQVETLSPNQIQSRVAARFPALDRLPHRPRLDSIVEHSGVGLTFDGSNYHFADARPSSVTNLQTRTSTGVRGSFTGSGSTKTAGDSSITRQRSEALLAQSIAERGFMAVKVPVPPTRPSAHLAVAQALADRYGGEVYDITGSIIDAMSATARERGISWDLVRAADAAPSPSKDATRLQTLVGLSMPSVINHLRQMAFSANDTSSPLVLTEPAALARYGAMDLLPVLSDLSVRRVRPIWLVLPQIRGQRGLYIDHRSVQLSSPGGQFVSWDIGWASPSEVEGA
ncbi:protein kinase [Rhodococcoides trifolii]|uniref:Protein kinase n=1 Tax=Rhodococcoides trifolii TaxID=908250 RepID=A0A917CXW8_9NOCA|nr:protein kinase [Rhodococcus trifolii]